MARAKKKLSIAQPPPTRLRGRAALGNTEEEWLRIRAVMPISVEPLWKQIQQRLRELGVTHPNKAVEAGMHVEILMAEFWSGTRYLDAEDWIGQYV